LRSGLATSSDSADQTVSFTVSHREETAEELLRRARSVSVIDHRVKAPHEAVADEELSESSDESDDT
jgi:hypothetical protein